MSIPDDAGPPVGLPDLAFDPAQYVAEVKRATTDRSWETRRLRIVHAVNLRRGSPSPPRGDWPISGVPLTGRRWPWTAPRRVTENEWMAEAHVLAHRQEWFVDPRSPDRRMCVTWHPGERLAVVSLWHGSRCTATFRLPAADSARVIAVLADGLATGWPDATGGAVTRKLGMFGQLRRWLRRSGPTTVPFTLIAGGGHGQSV